MGRYRELHEVSSKLQEQLRPLVEDAKSLPEVPPLDTKLLEAIEQPAEANAKRPARNNERPNDRPNARP